MSGKFGWTVHQGHRRTKPEITKNTFMFATTVNVLVRYTDLTSEKVAMVRNKGETIERCVDQCVDNESDWPCEIMYVSYRGKVVWQNPKWGGK